MLQHLNAHAGWLAEVIIVCFRMNEVASLTPAEDLERRFRALMQSYHDRIPDTDGLHTPSHARPTALASIHNYHHHEEQTRRHQEDHIGSINVGTIMLPQLVLPYAGDSISGKIICVFTALVEEVDRLERIANREFLPALAVISPAQLPEVSIASVIPLMQKLANYCQRIYNVIANIMLQLASFYHERSKLYQGIFKDVKLKRIVQKLGSLLRILITMDQLMIQNQNLEQSWKAHGKMWKYVMAEPDRFIPEGHDLGSVSRMDETIRSIEENVLGGAMFKNALSLDFSFSEEHIANVEASQRKNLVTQNEVLCNTMKEIVLNMFQENASVIDQSVEQDPRLMIVETYALFAFFGKIFEPISRIRTKQFKLFWSFQSKCPMIHLYGESVWFVTDFMQEYFLNFSNYANKLSPSPAKVSSSRLDFVRKTDESFSASIQSISVQVSAWLVRMESELVDGRKRSSATLFRTWTKLILNGLLYAKKIKTFATESIFLHLHLGVPFRKGNVRSISVCCEMLKGIESAYKRSSIIVDCYMQIITQIHKDLFQILSHISIEIENGKSFIRNPGIRDHISACLEVAKQSLNSPPSHLRLNLLKITMEIANISSAFKDRLLSDLEYNLWKLDMIMNYETQVGEACRCEFLYWIIELVEVMIEDIYLNPSQAHRLYYLLEALQDPTPMLKEEDKSLSHYKATVEKVLKTELLDRLCTDIEQDLSLHTHSLMLQQDNLHSVDTVQHEQMQRGHFLALRPLRLWDRFIDIKKVICHYLDVRFYNLLAGSLHRWKVYAEMRTLAKQKYDLDLTESHLPTHSHYSQTLDVLQIMRNIAIFVSRFNYNLNSQMFVERILKKKHLLILRLEDVANSIRTHGTGIMNTTVNFTYQFMLEQLNKFSQFLFDDHIRSRLINAKRKFNKTRSDMSSFYPYEHAEAFNDDIRSLGVNENGMTYLDHFRELITQIGNALGYVRMIRSGGLNACTASIQFIPNIEAIKTKELTLERISAEWQHSSQETIEAAENLDKLLQTLVKQFDEGTDYFAQLVCPFAKAFSKDQFGFLKNFYIIIPALTVSFVEKMLQQKERLKDWKTTEMEMSFTDDGFALGLAYILRVLNQEEQFDSLHWFASVKNSIRDLQESSANSQVNANRLRSLANEFDLLFYSFSGARIFFRTTKTQNIENETEDESIDQIDNDSYTSKDANYQE